MSKTTKTATTKTLANGSAKAGPNKPQLRILAALAKAKGPLSKERLAKASGVHPNWIAEYVGATTAMVSDLVSGKGPKKLAPAGLARIIEDDEIGLNYEVTAAGRKALERAEKAAK